MTIEEIAEIVAREHYEYKPMVLEVIKSAIELYNEGHSSRTCSQCGEHVQAGQARIAVQCDLNELEELIFATSINAVKRRFLCAMALLDPERADRILAELRTNALFRDDETAKPE